MPTRIARTQVTQTPPVARALEIAAKEWPEVPRSELLARLAALGAELVATAQADRRAARRRALDESHGTIDYPDGYLEELRRDWPLSSAARAAGVEVVGAPATS